MSKTLTNDDRGVSTTLSYALNLAIAAILVSGLLFAAGGTVEDQRQVSAREELRVVGERIAGAIQQADRMNRSGNTTELRLTVLAPRNVAGLQYTINLNASNEELVLTTENPDLRVEVPLNVESDLKKTDVRGGDIFIVLDNDKLRLGVA